MGEEKYCVIFVLRKNNLVIVRLMLIAECFAILTQCLIMKH